MKLKHALTAIGVAIAATAASAPASAAADYSLLFQGVTFEVAVVDSDSLTLTMLNTDAATGDWTGITNLNAFQLKGVGSFSSVTATGPGSFVNVDSELNAGGCSGGSGGDLHLCFSGLTAVAPSLSWTIDVTGGSWNIDSAGPHLKVRFGNDAGGKVGSLLSMDIPPVPEPETYAMMLAGLGALGMVARRRRKA